MRQKLIALIMVAIMALSVCAAVGLTTATNTAALTTATKTTTKLSLYTPSEVNYGESHAISVRLTDGSGHPLANKQVVMTYHFSGSTSYGYWTTIKTDSGGFASFVDYDRHVTYVYWKASFNGDTTYAGSTSYSVFKIEYGTSLSFYAPSTAKKYDKFMLSGTLGNGGGDKTIYLYYRYSGTTTWTYLKYVKTTASGYYSTAVIPSKTVTYYARFAGDSDHWGSTSVTRTVTVT